MIKKWIASTLIWWLCAITGVVALVWMSAAGMFRSDRAMRIAVAFDQLGNATGAGDEDETFSARCWRMRARPNYGRLQRAIDWASFVLQDEINHCENAFESERARRKRPYRVE